LSAESVAHHTRRDGQFIGREANTMHESHVVGIIELGNQAAACLVPRNRPTRNLAGKSAAVPAASDWLDADLDALSADLEVMARGVFARTAAFRRPRIARNR
jgi:hypothetical protein